MVSDANKFTLLALTNPSASEIFDYIKLHDCAEVRDALLTTDDMRKYYCVGICNGAARELPMRSFLGNTPLHTCLLLPDCWCSLGWPVHKQSNKDYFSTG